MISKLTEEERSTQLAPLLEKGEPNLAFKGLSREKDLAFEDMHGQF